ncbi:PH domain-containing protein [Klenkia brasiliensis]|uniref:PH domain-containing protein n=1 Tax=Klenkia brasiliensis TaxID=333142 RepID=A0A1G7VS58_9ACTN|nr:PH domain-containing protein [Klenkia brasiliensis]SDG62431.1 PH domain-containing protein [Klenkia brasiliensis]
MSSPATTTVSATPRRQRIMCGLMAAVIFAVMLVVSILLKTHTTGVIAFRTSDQVATTGLGIAMAAATVYLSRARVDADASGVRVRNIVGTHTLPWSAVRAVRFDENSPWASLLLVDDDELSVLAVQAADGERAVRAVEGMRTLLAASRSGGVPSEAPHPAT